MLQKDCALAMALLNKVMADPSPSDPAASARLPRDFLRSAAGLQFSIVETGGFGLSGSRGRAFTVARLGKTAGVSAWSGPAYSTCHAAGLGLTVGFDTLSTVTVLGTPDAVRAASQPGPRGGIELDLIAGKNKAVLQTEVDGDPVVPFAVASGGLLDVSAKVGAYLPDKKKNAAVYGKAVAPADILAGHVDHPIEMEPLYELMSALAGEHEEFQA
jgi:lipid-binding SYLF domain-containing protein